MELLCNNNFIYDVYGGFWGRLASGWVYVGEAFTLKEFAQVNKNIYVNLQNQLFNETLANDR